jgi:hypothetical protein
MKINHRQRPNQLYQPRPIRSNQSEWSAKQLVDQGYREPTYIPLAEELDQTYRFLMDISLQRLDLRLSVVHSPLRYKARLIRLLGGLEEKSRVIKSQPQSIGVYRAEICYGEDGSVHVRSHCEIAGFLPCGALGDCCHVCESVAFAVVEALADRDVLIDSWVGCRGEAYSA